MHSFVEQPALCAADPREIIGPCGIWHAVRTRARQEKRVAEWATSLGIEIFLPLVRRVRYYGRRKAASMLPLFPGYLFVEGSLEESYHVERSDRVAQVLRVADQDRLARDLWHLREALARGAVLEPGRFLQAGMRVEVNSGPFRGVQGLIDREAREDRMVLQIDVLGRGAELEIERQLLSLVD